MNMLRHTKPRVNTDTPRRPRPPVKVSLADDELAAAMNASRDLPYEKRNLFLQRLFAQLQLSGTVTIGAAIQRALTGLQHR